MAKGPWQRVRWALCPACEHLARYHVRADRGKRLRDRHCERCGALLGRGRNRAAQPLLKSRRQAIYTRRRLIRGMGGTLGFSTLREELRGRP
jgi:hypothetical protein